jgi:hypothetical protein
MHRTLVIVGACASAVLALGCAHMGTQNDEAMLGRLTMDAKQPIYAAQHNVSVSESNVASAERAKKEADEYRSIANKEYDASKSRLQAAQKSVDLGRKTGGATLENAEQALPVAQRELEAYQAKKDYASRLSDLRGRELDAAKKRRDLANVDLRIARADVLQRNGMRSHENFGDLQKKRDDLIGDLAGLDRRIALLDQEVGRLRVAWQDRRTAFNVASRGLPAIPAPPPPKQLTPSSRAPGETAPMAPIQP